MRQKPHQFKVWGQVGQESNLQPAVLETAALPIELPTYRQTAHHASVPRQHTAPPPDSQASVAQVTPLIGLIRTTRANQQ